MWRMLSAPCGNPPTANSSPAPESRDLDGRDSHYDHLLLIEPSSGALAGAARLQFMPSSLPS